MLGAAATFINGKAYKQEELLDKGKYKVLRVGNFFTNMDWYFSDLELDEDKYCDSGDLLYAWSASFGPRIWTDGKVIYHYHIWKVIEAKGICKQFLFVLLDNETERIKVKSSNGLGLLHITKGAIEGWGCCIPNFGEQQKIADFLTSLDEIITLEIQKLDTLKTYKKGLLQQLFPGEGETLPKLRFPNFEGDEKWEVDALFNVALFVNEKISIEQAQINSYVSTQNILSDYNGITFAKTLPTTGFVTRYQVNDVLVSNIRPYLKKVWHSTNEGATSNDVIVIRAKDKLLPYFLSFQLKNNAFIDYVMTSAKGVKMPRGDINLMKAYPTFYPSLLEQQKIADCLSSIEDVITLGEQKINALKTHKKGLMQQLFPTLNEEQP